MKLDRAERAIKRGQAKWVRDGISVRFIRTDPSSLNAELRLLDRDTAYDFGRATREQMKGTPIVHPEKLLAPSSRKRWAWEQAVHRNKQGRTAGERTYLQQLAR